MMFDYSDFLCDFYPVYIFLIISGFMTPIHLKSFQ